MSNFSQIERNIIKLLDRFPVFRKFIKYLYQYFCFILYREKESYYLNTGLSIESLSNEAASFWGYYDKSPVRQNKILLHYYKTAKTKRNDTSLIQIKLNNKTVSATKSWNWQQGSRLCWINDNQFIHNDFDGEKYISKIININTNQVKIIDFPIYSVSKDGNFALSLNFQRLAKLSPDYGYFNLSLNEIKKIDKNDGVFYVDLLNNEVKQVISFETLLSFKHKETMINTWHKVNHIDISPDNKRFMFHHRWYSPSGKKYSRLLTANIDGSGLFCLADDDMVSHCCWKNDKEIISWARRKDIGDKYFLFYDKSNDFNIIGDGILKEDGHPSVSPCGKWLLTDTYPDKTRMSHLLLYHFETAKIIELGKFFTPMRYFEESRCDLHPRWNSDGKGITFDSVHENVRKTYQLSFLDDNF